MERHSWGADNLAAQDKGHNADEDLCKVARADNVDVAGGSFEDDTPGDQTCIQGEGVLHWAPS